MNSKVLLKVTHGLGIFMCPGCKTPHRVTVNGALQAWSWNGSETSPTLDPSLYFSVMDPSLRCHSFIKDGKIMFLTDSYHELRGQTVDIPEWE